MFEESHLGHLKFWFSELGEVELVAAAAVLALELLVLLVVVEEGHEEEGREGDGVEARTPPLTEILVSPGIRPAPPNSSWIIFFIFVDLQTIQNHEKQKGESF